LRLAVGSDSSARRVRRPGILGRVNAVERVLAMLRRGPASAQDAPRVIGIDGPAGSGKSTLAADIAAAIGAPVVGVDDFLGWTDLDPERVTWWPRLEAEVLEPF